MDQLRFAVVCILPCSAICGFLLGGPWNWLGLTAYFVLYVAWDTLGPADLTPPTARGGPLHDVMLFVQLPLVFIAWLGFLAQFSQTKGILPVSLGWLGVATGVAQLGPTGVLDLVGTCASLVVTIAIAGIVTAHELIHRTWSPISVLTGRILLAFSFDAAFSIEHVYGHHAKVGMYEDPTTARRGETLYRFIRRSTVQSWRSAWSIENHRLARRGNAVWSWHNRNVRGIALSLALLLATAIADGLLAACAFLATCLIAKAVLAMTNYVEHYGLVRVSGTPVAPRHSWDTPAPVSAIGMFNLGRHAAHHVKANQPYWALALADDSPKMPGGVPLTALLSTMPWLWRRIMAPRLAHWDLEQATEAERELARAHAGSRWRVSATDLSAAM